MVDCTHSASLSLPQVVDCVGSFAHRSQRILKQDVESHPVKSNDQRKKAAWVPIITQLGFISMYTVYCRLSPAIVSLLGVILTLITLESK